MKQTLEEVAEIYENSYLNPTGTEATDFIAGANWQKEQQDDFAVEFAEWYLSNRHTKKCMNETDIEGQYKVKPTQELLQIFKKEKGL